MASDQDDVKPYYEVESRLGDRSDIKNSNNLLAHYLDDSSLTSSSL